MKRQSYRSHRTSITMHSSNSQNSQNFNSYKAQQIQELKQIFKMYDRNNTGNITSRTLKFLLRGLGDNVNEEQVDEILLKMDEDGNGTIDFRQFLLYMLQKINNQSLCDDIIEIFKIFDRDDTGYITAVELKIITKGLIDQKMINAFCEEADLNKQGQIHYRTYLQKLLK